LPTTASSTLRSEIERCSGAEGFRRGGLTGWQAARVRTFVDENLHCTIHTKDLSVIARLSTAHFSRSFRQTFGQTPHAYVVTKRLERACHLMTISSAPLAEIALRVGFYDQAHLSRLFRKAFGQSPFSWRRERIELPTDNTEAELASLTRRLETPIRASEGGSE
jgi:AraC family transcriptional regulator